MKYVFALLFIIFGPQAWAQSTSAVQWTLSVKGSGVELASYPTQTACDAAARARTTPGVVVYECPRSLRVTNPTPPPPPPTPTGGAMVYISPSGTDSAAGTQAAPRRTLTGSMISTAAPGTTFLMECNATHTMGGKLAFRNPNATDANRITVAGYGDCAAGPAVLSYPANTVSALEFGLNFGDGAPHQGYTFRDLRFVRAPSTNEGWGIYLKNDISKFTLDRISFQGWTTNINAQGGHRTRECVIQNSNLGGFNGGHGVLGRFTNCAFLNNISQPGATGFTHAFYLSEGSGNVLRGNRIVSTGACTGGGITMHSGYTTGQGETAPKAIDGVTVEGNTFEYASSTPACYAVSLSPYESAPGQGGFRNVIVRNNRITNASTGINVVAAPGALIDGNVLIEVASPVSYRNYAEDPADLAGPGTVRDNTSCRVSGGGGFSAPAGSTLTNNVTLTGAAATSGVCSR